MTWEWGACSSDGTGLPFPNISCFSACYPSDFWERGGITWCHHQICAVVWNIILTTGHRRRVEFLLAVWPASAQTERSLSCTQCEMWQLPSSFKTSLNGLLLSLLFEELLQTAASLPGVTWCADVSQLWLPWQGSYHQGGWGIFAMCKACKTKHFPCQNSRGNGIALLQLLINQCCYVCRA